MEAEKAEVRLLVADAKAAEVVEPGESCLDHPAGPSEAAAMGLVLGSREFGPDAPLSESGDVGAPAVAAITLQCLWAEAWASAQSLDWRKRVDKFDCRNAVGDVGWRGLDNEWRAPSVSDYVAFAPEFATICGIRTRVRAPETARTDALSITAHVRVRCGLALKSVGLSLLDWN